jgi:hypothetical protein
MTIIIARYNDSEIVVLRATWVKIKEHGPGASMSGVIPAFTTTGNRASIAESEPVVGLTGSIYI